MKPILEVQGVSKEFLIGGEQEKYLTLRDKLANPVKLFQKPKVQRFKALDNVSFDVKPGESIGIVGRNGAGKSTLLKILSKITPPTTGRIISRGRIASLLEVGTGFHPELTGRENIYMNGSILGMRKTEIEKHFDAIVSFSGVEKFLDTPLKHYSSGMQLRLAFAVAAHLEPEILVIDEVLAVGDAEFQKKCLGKMDEVSKSGRTILFVSHNMAAVQNLCTKAVFLKGGTVVMHDSATKVIDKYLSENNKQRYSWQGEHQKNEYLKVNEICLVKKDKVAGDVDDVFITDTLVLKLNISVVKDVSGLAVELFIKTIEGVDIFSSITRRYNLHKGEYEIACEFPPNILNDMNYSFTIGLSKDYSNFILKLDDILLIHVNNKIDELGGWHGEYPGMMRPQLSWKVNETEPINA